MAGRGITPTIRVQDVARALAFYVDMLGFTLERGGPQEDNSSLSRGDAGLMIETATDFYGDAYNEAIRGRLESRSAIALYIEALDLDDLYERVKAAGVRVMDPLADRSWGQAEFTIEDPDGTWLTFWRGPGAS